MRTSVCADYAPDPVRAFAPARTVLGQRLVRRGGPWLGMALLVLAACNVAALAPL